tara:strand:+ start:407 stop:1642 length:1236 start_codon:yes stop_codon:yes gene_type:complete
MASSYSSDLKFELQVTGENPGTWGDKTNNNFNVVQQAVAGYEEVNVASGDVTLVMSNAAVSNARNMSIKFTGTLAANRTVNMPASIEKFFNIIDGTDHAGYTLTFKVTSQTGFLLCEGNHYVCHSNGTDIVKDQETRYWRVIAAAETVQAGAQILVDTSSGAVTITLPASPAAGDEVTFLDSENTFDSNNLTVARNSSNINGAASNLVVANERAAFTLVYSGDATVGWQFKNRDQSLHSGSDMLLDSGGDIILDADGADVIFKDAGTEVGRFTNSSTDFVMQSATSDKDIIFKGNDGGSTITALTLDMSAAGAATFNNDVTAFSDERLKDNIETIDSALDKVTNMRGVTFDRDGRRGTGVIAQEMQKVMPEVVHDEGEYMSVAYGNLVGVLIEAVKELKAEIEELKHDHKE